MHDHERKPLTTSLFIFHVEQVIELLESLVQRLIREKPNLISQIAAILQEKIQASEKDKKAARRSKYYQVVLALLLQNSSNGLTLGDAQSPVSGAQNQEKQPASAQCDHSPSTSGATRDDCY